jgi:hypothetical protein
MIRILMQLPAAQGYAELSLFPFGLRDFLLHGFLHKGIQLLVCLAQQTEEIRLCFGCLLLQLLASLLDKRRG